MTPLVIVPARAGSKGVPNKNFKELPDGSTLLSRAVDIGLHLGGLVAISSDADIDAVCDAVSLAASTSTNVKGIRRPAALAQDDTPMRDVVEHVLSLVPGEPDQPIVLLQPTTPLRTLNVVQAVLSQCVAFKPFDTHGYTTAYRIRVMVDVFDGFGYLPLRRQDESSSWVPTGEAYAFIRKNGFPNVWNIIESRPTVNVDTPDDWDALCAIIANRQTSPSAP
jgi:N-acylneuraminate cytidylyltransferase